MRTTIFEKIETKEFTHDDVELLKEFQKEMKKGGHMSLFCQNVLIEILKEVESSGSLFGRVAFIGDRVIGFIFGDTKPKWYLEPDSAWLLAIVVHPEFRRRGIGRRLLAEFLDQCRELGLKKVCVVAEYANEETIGFLQKMGFKAGKFVQFEKQI